MVERILELSGKKISKKRIRAVLEKQKYIKDRKRKKRRPGSRK